MDPDVPKGKERRVFFHPIPFSFLKELYYGIKKLDPE